MPRYSVSVLIETDHAGMVEFSKSLSLMLPMIAGSSKIVNAVITQEVKCSTSSVIREVTLPPSSP